MRGTQYPIAPHHEDATCNSTPPKAEAKTRDPPLAGPERHLQQTTRLTGLIRRGRATGEDLLVDEDETQAEKPSCHGWTSLFLGSLGHRG